MDRNALFAAAISGDTNAIAVLEKEVGLDFDNGTILHSELNNGNAKHVEFIVRKFADKLLLFKENHVKETALHVAAKRGEFKMVQVLIDAARSLVANSSANEIDPLHPISSLADFVWHPNHNKNSALHLALSNRHVSIAKLLVEASSPRNGHDMKNQSGETPVYLAVKLGYNDIVTMMCASFKDGLPLDGPDDCTTVLHAAINNIQGREDGNVVMSLIYKRKRNMEISYPGSEALFDTTDQNYRTVLSLSVLTNQPMVVEQILAEDPAYKNGRVRKINDLKSLISVADKKEYTDMVKLLKRKYEARKNIGHEGQTALHSAIVKRQEASVIRHLIDGDKSLVSTADSEKWTPLHYAAYYEFDSILDAVYAGYKVEEYQSANKAWWIPTPLHVAAKEGHTSTVAKLMDLLPPSLYATVDSLSHQNILHLAVVQRKREMILDILEKCPGEYIEKILNQQDVNGDTPLHLLIRDGFFVPELIKHKKVDRMLKNKQHRTSFDMLYFEDQIIADQAKIKKALVDFQADQDWKFWQHLKLWCSSIKKKPKKPESVVPPGKQTTKDKEFIKAMKLLKKAELLQKKDELDRYRQRTNTQIIVTALITTVTFTVGFTMPGGLHQDGELKGMVILSKKKAFIAFMVSDALALLLSTSSLFLYFIASMYEDLPSVSKLNDASTVLNIVSVIAMILTFITGTYVVLSHSRALAFAVIVISSFFFLLVVVGLLIKWRYDRKQEKVHDV